MPVNQAFRLDLLLMLIGGLFADVVALLAR
jgi:hypothetical protein